MIRDVVGLNGIDGPGTIILVGLDGLDGPGTIILDGMDGLPIGIDGNDGVVLIRLGLTIGVMRRNSV